MLARIHADRLAGHGAGADAEPKDGIGDVELMVRIRAVLRRANRAAKFALGFAVHWYDAPKTGGEMILRDAAGLGRDYAVFGEVVEGMDVVLTAGAIATLPEPPIAGGWLNRGAFACSVAMNLLALTYPSYSARSCSVSSPCVFLQANCSMRLRIASSP